MSSSAVAQPPSTATSRKSTKPAKGASPDPADVRYSTRQAKAYKKEELQQFNVPELTIKDLLTAIPKHCFERSTLKSSIHLLGDFVVVAALGYAASWINPGVASINFDASPLTPYISASAQASVVKAAGWASYWWWQGLAMTGIWVVAHEW